VNGWLAEVARANRLEVAPAFIEGLHNVVWQWLGGLGNGGEVFFQLFHGRGCSLCVVFFFGFWLFLVCIFCRWIWWVKEGDLQG